MPLYPTVDDGGTDTVTVVEDNGTLVAIDESSTADTILHTAHSLLDDMNINNDDSNEGQNAVGGGDTEERAPNTTEKMTQSCWRIIQMQILQQEQLSRNHHLCYST